MDIKRFEKGQKAYILDMHNGRNWNPEIREATVDSVGRKYVTVDSGRRYKETEDLYSLKEVTDCGWGSLLCPCKECAESFIERDRLRTWLRLRTNNVDEYTLEQLRGVHRILSGSVEELEIAPGTICDKYCKYLGIAKDQEELDRFCFQCELQGLLRALAG